MERVFEDEFMDLHSSIIDLCRELTRDSVDMIYAYAIIEGRSYSFNAFFTKQGKVLTLRELNIGRETVSEFLGIGNEELIKIDDVCKKYGKKTPTEIKMIYDVRTKQFTSEYRYTPMETMDVGFPDFFMGWINEIDPTYK